MKPKHYRTLEDRLAGIPWIERPKRPRSEPIINPKTGNRLSPTFAKERKHNRKDYWFARAKFGHPDYDPALAIKHYEATQRGALKRKGARIGIPMGWGTKEWRNYFKEKMAQSRLFIKDLFMAEAFDDALSDNEMAVDALTFAHTVMSTEQLPIKERLAAARTILDFTKAKPAQKADVTVKSAEDWLKSLAGVKIN